MRPTKKKTAKKRNPMVGKQLNLKYRINAYRELNGNTNETKEDRDLVFDMINGCKYSDNNNIHTDHMKLANGLWKKYETN